MFTGRLCKMERFSLLPFYHHLSRWRCRDKEVWCDFFLFLLVIWEFWKCQFFLIILICCWSKCCSCFYFSCSADFCLVHLLLTRHPGMLFQHFVECVFHFNSFTNHKGIAMQWLLTYHLDLGLEKSVYKSGKCVLWFSLSICGIIQLANQSVCLQISVSWSVGQSLWLV